MQVRPRIVPMAAALALLALTAGCSPHSHPLAPGSERGGARPAAVFADNVPPTVQIESPHPSLFIAQIVPLGFSVRWTGHDPDGADPDRLAGYRYLLIAEDSPEFQVARVDPDSLRRRYAPSFPGWTALPGEADRVTPDGLELGKRYVFVVVGFDDQGASTAVFSFSTNMLLFRVVPQGSVGPRFTVWSDLFRYEFPTGGVHEGGYEPRYDVPAPELEVRWSATPIEGTFVVAYRWAVDIADPADESPRRGPVDLRHWSAWDPAGTAATVSRRFPPPPSDARRLSIEALDSNGFISRVTVMLDLARGRPVRPAAERGGVALR